MNESTGAPPNFRHPDPALTRRAAIQAGGIAILGLGMNHMAALRALAASPPRPTAKAAIYIFLSGGLAQHESFDLKPDASDDIRGEFRPIRTRTPGIQICEHLPELAKRSDRWALVRSLTHPYNEHSQGHLAMLAGRTELPPGFDPGRPLPTDWPSIAAVAMQLAPRRNNLPPAIVLPERLVHRTGRVIPGQSAGLMGSAHEPWFLEMSPFHANYGAHPEYLFHHEKGAVSDEALRFQAPHLTLPHGLTRERLVTRARLREELERQRGALERAGGSENFDAHRQTALSLLLEGKVADAFDLGKADAASVRRYGRNSFGWSLLMARRLVEAGASLVQVNLGNNETWDTHQEAWPNLKNWLLPPMDRAVSALLDDLGGSGLLDETLVVMAGEFGRTPKISTIRGARSAGRDHWGACQTVFLAGGGVRGGTVVGASDRDGGYPASDPQTPENLAATIYRALGLPATAAWSDPLGRPHYVYHGDPIRGLV